MHYKAIFKNLFFQSWNFSLLLILFITAKTVEVQALLHLAGTQIFTLECSLIYILPYSIHSFVIFFILDLVAKSIDLVLLLLPKWIIS